MKQIRVFLVGFTAVLGLSLAVSPAAFAELEFNSNAMGNLVSKATETQVFTTSAGKVSCSNVKTLSGEAPLHALAVSVTVKYEGCEAFGIPATISPSLYQFLTNGELHITKLITVEAGFGTCEVKVPAQAFKTIKYINKGGKLEIVSEATGVKTSGVGTCSYAEESKGVYTGRSLVELPGALIEA